MIKEIKRGGLSLVPKLPKGMNIPKRDIAWGFSFNDAEKILLDNDSAIRNNCTRPILLILENLRKDYKWPDIRSYHLKTVVLHEFESHHPSNWTSENMLSCLKQVLHRLKVSLQKRNFPHYFIAVINLFERFDRMSCERIIGDIDKFLQNPNQALEMLNGKVCTGKQCIEIQIL